MARKRKVKAPVQGPAVTLDYERIPVADGAVRGADGRPVKRGKVVRMPVRYSESLRATVPTRVGLVRDIFRERGEVILAPDRVVVEAVDGSARYFFDATLVRRSQAGVEAC